MISISKSKFLVLGFVFVALMLIPTSNTFAQSTGNVGDGTSNVDVYDYPFEITVIEGGSFTIHNSLDRIIDIGNPGWFRGIVYPGDSTTFKLDGTPTSGVTWDGSVMGTGTTLDALGSSNPMMLRDWLTGDYDSTVTIIAGGSVDLKFKEFNQDVWLTPENTVYDVNNDMTFRVEGIVENSGSGTIVTWHGSKMSLVGPNGEKPYSDTSVGCYNAEIGPGETCDISNNVRINSDLTLGTWTYTITLDPDNDHAETDEGNNIQSGTFEVVNSRLGGDLKFNSVTQNVDEITGDNVFDINSDGHFRVEGIVENAGTGTIETWHGSKMSVTGPNGEKPFADTSAGCYNAIIGPGETCAISNGYRINSDVSLGTWTYTITLDPDNDWIETNEDNNVHTGTFEVVDASVSSTSTNSTSTNSTEVNE